jgi:predicted ribosome quality control (RQC) complex YloA/Tae2 family protein
MNKDKIKDKIKELNAVRAMYHRDFEEYEQKYYDHNISREAFEKQKRKYEKQRETIRRKIHKLEEKLERLGK